MADRKDACVLQVSTNRRMPAALAVVSTLGFFALQACHYRIDHERH